jgi:hypothetical protein
MHQGFGFRLHDKESPLWETWGQTFPDFYV